MIAPGWTGLVAVPDWSGAAHWTAVPGGAVGAGAVLVLAVRATAALAEARLRAGDWPVWRSGPAVAAVVGHDVAVGLAGFAAVAVLPWSLTTGTAAEVAGGVGALVSLLVTGLVLHRRRGVPLAALGRPGALAQEPAMTARQRLLSAVERNAARASARWITARLDRCRRRAAVPDDHLLAAVWAPGRIRLRESVGVGRTEVALLLLQAQAVVDDASPPQERLLTLLHLLHDRCGRRGVRAVLDQAVRGPLRHGHPAAPLPLSPATPFPETVAR